jgi:large subunit ribosomal protein L29
MKENADKARALDAMELDKQLRDGAEQMFRLRFQLRIGQADGLKKLRGMRKERARMLTVQRERELGKSVAPAADVKSKKGKAAAPKAEKKAAAPKVKKESAAKAPKAAAKSAAHKTAKENPKDKKK